MRFENGFAELLHVLRKDVTGLTWEIAVMAAAAIGLGMMEVAVDDFAIRTAGFPRFLLTLCGAAYLTVRVVHAEAIAGHTQFWLTRPYRWWPLMGAKLAFILLFGVAPILIAEILVSVSNGFALTTHLDAWAWTFFLTFAIVLLPVAALAALTRGIAMMILVAIGLTVIAWTIPDSLELWPGVVEWYRTALVGLCLGGISGGVVILQYRFRNTSRTALGAAGAATAAILLVIAFPYSWALALGWEASVDGIGGDDVVVEVGNDARPVSGPRADHVRLVFMFGLAESGDTIESRWDWIEATLEGPDGAAWAIETADPRGPASIDIEQDRLRLIADVPETLVQQWRGGPVTLSGFAYLTVFGAARPETFTLSTEPVRMPEGVECALPSYGFLLTGFSCRRPHRGPTALLTHTNPPFSMDSFSRGFPYPLPTGTSPFPSGLFPNRIWESGAGASFQAINLETFDPRAYYAEGTEVTIIYRERLGFLRETFEFSIDLDDFLRE